MAQHIEEGVSELHLRNKPVPHTVITVRALPGGQFETTGRIPFSDKQGAMRTANSLQQQFDEDCEPCRTYVLNKDGLPVAAGGAAVMSARQSLQLK